MYRCNYLIDRDSMHCSGKPSLLDCPCSGGLSFFWNNTLDRVVDFHEATGMSCAPFFACAEVGCAGLLYFRITVEACTHSSDFSWTVVL